MAALLARREAEGLSLRAIAEDAGIPFGTLSWWSWRLRQDPTPAVDAEGGFVELVATAQPEPSDADLVFALGVARVWQVLTTWLACVRESP